MGNLEHPLLIVQFVNALLDPVIRPLFLAVGRHPQPGAELIPDYLVMSGLVVLAWTALGLFLRSRLSVEQPGRMQIVLEDLLGWLVRLMDEWIGPHSRQFLPLVGALGAFILVGNYMGLLPGLMAPTSNMNVPAGCAITIWIYYHIQGVRAQGIVAYLKHFAVPPGMPAWLAPLMLIIEVVSHVSRVLSLTLRLFGNIFGEETLIAILAMLVPLVVPLPMMLLALITGALQALIFVVLSIIYLQAATAVEHHDDAPVHTPPHEYELAEVAQVAGI